MYDNYNFFVIGYCATELPNWNPRRIPIPAGRWYRIIDGILRTAGESGLWFSGFGALPFDVPLHPNEPKGWRTPANTWPN